MNNRLYFISFYFSFYFIFDLRLESSMISLLLFEAITHDGQPCLTLDSLWNVLYNIFNTALNRQVDLNVINEIENKPSQNWSPFSKNEFRSAISKCSDSLVPEPDKLTWHHLKFIIKDDSCLTNIVNITDACINLGHWLEYFKI